MLKLDNHRVDISCPRCKFLNKVSLKQVRIGDIVICRGCKINIRLEDHRRSTHKANRELQRAMNAMFDELSKIGKITIKL